MFHQSQCINHEDGLYFNSTPAYNDAGEPEWKITTRHGDATVAVKLDAMERDLFLQDLANTIRYGTANKSFNNSHSFISLEGGDTTIKIELHGLYPHRWVSTIISHDQANAILVDNNCEPATRVRYPVASRGGSRYRVV